MLQMRETELEKQNVTLFQQVEDLREQIAKLTCENESLNDVSFRRFSLDSLAEMPFYAQRYILNSVFTLVFG